MRIFSRPTSACHAGSIVRHKYCVEVLLPRGQDPFDLFAQQLRPQRPEALQTVENALLRKQLDEPARRIVFDDDPKDSVWRHEGMAPMFRMRWGATTKLVDLTPRKFKGELAGRALRTITFTSQTAAEVWDSVDVLEECLKSPNLRKNMDISVASAIIRCAARVGIYGEIFDRLMLPENIFRKHLTSEFYSEALRIHALRTPFYSAFKKSHRTIDNFRVDLGELYARAKQTPGREMCLAYALAVMNKHALVADDGTKMGLERVLNNVGELDPTLPFYKGATEDHTNRIDLLLYLEALRLSSLPQFELTRRKVESALSKGRRNRRLQRHYFVDASDLETEEIPLRLRWGTYDTRF